MFNFAIGLSSEDRNMSEEETEIQELQKKLFKTYDLEEDPKLFCEECEDEVNDNVCRNNEDHQLLQIIEKGSNKIRLSPCSGDNVPSPCSDQPCSNGLRCFRPHGDTEYKLWKDMKYISYVVHNPRTEPPKPELPLKMCTKMMEKGRCPYKNCDYAHSKGEYKKWKKFHDSEDEKERERAFENPRKDPPEYRTPQMCKLMEKTGRCRYKMNCKFAHSQRELGEWKKRIKEIKESLDFSRLKQPKTAETADTLLAVFNKSKDKPKSIRLVLDLLVAYETQQYNGTISIQTMDRVSNIVEVSKFLNELAICLHNLVFNTTLLKEQFEVESNEEHQEMYHCILLDVIRHKPEPFGQSGDLIYTYATLLQAMCHRIVHQCYLITDGDSEVFSPTLVGTEGFVKTLFLYSIDFIKEINKQGQTIPLDTTNLEKIRDEFKPVYIE